MRRFPLLHFVLDDLPSGTKAPELDDANAVISLRKDAEWTKEDVSAGAGVTEETRWARGGGDDDLQASGTRFLSLFLLLLGRKSRREKRRRREWRFGSSIVRVRKCKEEVEDARWRRVSGG